MNIDPKVLQRHMIFVLFVGAARADATPQQMESLHDQLLPMMEDLNTPLSRCVLCVIDIMGEDWAPAGQWREWINNMAGREVIPA